MKKVAILVAGGKGTRLGGTVPKQFQLLCGKSVIWHSVKAFTQAFKDIRIILVLPSDQLEKGKEFAADLSSNKIQVTTGGQTRFQSVKNGLQFCDDDAMVFVHDAARCLITPQLIKRCFAAAMEKGNAVPTISATDSIRILTSDGNELIDRNKIRIIQTPQVFPATILKKAFQQEYEVAFTDEATVVERTGIKIHLVNGEESNIKITTPTDLLVAEKILRSRA